MTTKSPAASYKEQVEQQRQAAEAERQRKLEAATTLLQATIGELARIIYFIAAYIELTGNHGLTAKTIGEQATVDVRVLHEDYFVVYEGILFHNDDRKFNGWMVRKNPYWKTVWVKNYGHLPECAEIMAEIEAAKIAAAEAAKPKRKVESFAGGTFERMETLVIGRMWAIAFTMMRRYHHEYRDASLLTPRRDLLSYSYRVWSEQYNVMWDELKYRAAVGDLDAKHITAVDEYEAALMWFSSLQIEDIENGKAWPLDLELKDPLPVIPKVVHVKGSEWINCADDERVYIGRKMGADFPASKWGNPHKVGKEENRLNAIAAYEHDLMHNADLLEALEELRGKRVIGCWCKSADRGWKHWTDTDKPCHGDVLVRLLALPQAELDKLIAVARGEDIQDGDE